MQRRFRLVDLFGERPLTGNSLAMVIDSEGLTTEQMLDIPRWLNFSETSFLSPPESPDAEMHEYPVTGSLNASVAQWLIPSEI